MSESSAPKKADYAVGYRRPPEHSRFKKGRSGNASGRRRYTDSERAKHLMRQEATRLVSIREGEKVVRIPALQAAIRSVLYSAAKGNSAAQRLVLNAVFPHVSQAAAGENGPIEISWLPTEYSAADVLEELDLTALTEEQRTQFQQILALALPKTSGK